MTVYSLSLAPRVAERVAVQTPAGEPSSAADLARSFKLAAQLDLRVDLLRTPAEAARFLIDGEEIVHRPAFEVLRDGEAVLVDVVAESDYPSYPLRPVLIGGEVEARDGRRLIVETAESLRAEPRHSTLKLVLACRRTFVSAGDRVRILHHLEEAGISSLVAAAGVVRNGPDGVAAVLALAMEGLVALEIDRPILPETRVRRRKLAPAEE